MRSPLRVWVLFVVGLLGTLSGLGAIWATAHERITAAESSVVLADGVDPTAPSVVEQRTRSVTDAIRYGAVTRTIDIAPYKGEDVSQLNGYVDNSGQLLISNRDTGVFWPLPLPAYLQPASLLLIGGFGMLVASAFIAASRHASRLASGRR